MLEHLAETSGWIASACVLAAFLMRDMRPLRLVAMASNVAFIAYAAQLGLLPILLLHAALLPINLYRLWEQGRVDRASQGIPRRKWAVTVVMLAALLTAWPANAAEPMMSRTAPTQPPDFDREPRLEFPDRQPVPDVAIEPFAVAGAAGVLELPASSPSQNVPVVVILHDGGEPDTRSAIYITQLLGAGIAVLDVLMHQEDGLGAVVAALAVHPRLAGERMGVLGFGAGARLGLANLSSGIQARALLYPGCAGLPAARLPGDALLLLSGTVDETNPPDACAAAVERLAAGGATIRWTIYPGATYAWDFPRHGIEGPLRLLAADATSRVLAQPWPELAALSASQVAGFFATQLLRSAP